jgi:hypothetical protein
LLGIEVFHFVCNASDHAAAPPTSVMNSRRFIIRSARRRGRAASAEFRG